METLHLLSVTICIKKYTAIYIVFYFNLSFLFSIFNFWLFQLKHKIVKSIYCMAGLNNLYGFTYSK